MEQKEELILKFEKLHNQLLQEIITKQNVDEINDLSELYDEYSNMYDELKNNYGIDYKNEFNQLNDYMLKYANTLKEGQETKNQFENSIEKLQTYKSSNELENETIDSLIEKLIQMITNTEEFKNIKTTLTIVNDIDNLVNRIVGTIFNQIDAGKITKEQQNNYFKKISMLGFKKNDPNYVFDINDKFKKISLLAEEKSESKDLGETNEILKVYLDYVDKLKETISIAENEGIICKKQVELYDVVFEEYKNVMFSGKRM